MPLPFVRYSTDQRYNIIEPGVESDFFKLDNPVLFPGAAVALALDGTNRFVTKSVPPVIGDVIGPGSSTDNAVVRFDGTSGKIIQTRLVIVDDLGNMSGVATLGATTVNATTVNATTVGATNVNASGTVAAGTVNATTVNATTVGTTDVNASGTVTAGTVNAGTVGATTINVTTINGGTLSGNNTGNVTLTAFGSSPTASGASLSGGTGQALTLEPADGSHPGGVSTAAQQFIGVKTFLNPPTIPDGTSANPGLNFTSFTGAGLYRESVSGSLALSSQTAPRYITFHRKNNLTNNIGNDLFRLDGMQSYPAAFAKIDYGMHVSDLAGSRQVTSGSAWFVAYELGGVTVAGFTNEFAATITNTGSLMYFFSVFPQSPTGFIAQVTPQSSLASVTTLDFFFSLTLVNDPGITLTLL